MASRHLVRVHGAVRMRCIRRTALPVDAAAELVRVVMDDETGMCFLPDSTIIPEEDREWWEPDLTEMRAGPEDPTTRNPDGRAFLEKLTGSCSTRSSG